ncbi:MAG TPA: alpha/beta fold hydrolase [Rhizomicrobium sp.]|nr:alpha/beta fold hydrolase [Rhizomicrobium sp.]
MTRVAVLLGAAILGAFFSSMPAIAADYPAPRDASWTLDDFKFHTGESLPEVTLRYLTIGDPKGAPVLLLHGTGSAAESFLSPAFAGELFGRGQPLDAEKYFLIIPDALGHGKSTKPSDGLKAKFPHYDYADMVDAEYRLLTEGLRIRHLRLVMGNSMGGMMSWVWAERYPAFMDALVPMASQPAAMSGRNWMLRRLLIETVRNDPDYHNGDYAVEPRSLKYANAFFGIATSGGTLNYQKQAPTSAAADKIVAARLAGRGPADANDFIWQWQASADYDPAPGLVKIAASVLAINAADDERNPPETGIEAAAMKKVRNGRLYLIPAGEETSGHGTTGNARFYKEQLKDFLEQVPGQKGE